MARGSSSTDFVTLGEAQGAKANIEENVPSSGRTNNKEIGQRGTTATQSTTEFVVMQVELGGFHSKIAAPTE